MTEHRDPQLHASTIDYLRSINALPVARPRSGVVALLGRIGDWVLGRPGEPEAPTFFATREREIDITFAPLAFFALSVLFLVGFAVTSSFPYSVKWLLLGVIFLGVTAVAVATIVVLQASQPRVEAPMPQPRASDDE